MQSDSKTSLPLQPGWNIWVRENYYGAPITIVPFTYQFSALDRQNKLLESGNAEIKEINDQGASADPAYYLNCYDLVNSDYYDTPKTLSNPPET